MKGILKTLKQFLLSLWIMTKKNTAEIWGVYREYKRMKQQSIIVDYLMSKSDHKSLGGSEKR